MRKVQTVFLFKKKNGIIDINKTFLHTTAQTTQN